MTGEQTLPLALELHEMSWGIAREGIRRQNPKADVAEVERPLRHRLALARADMTFKLGRAGLALFCLNCLLLDCHAAAPSSGLIVQASDGTRSAVWVAPTPNFNLTNHQSIHPQLEPQFKAEWSGFLKLVRGGKYRIHGDARIVVGGQEARAEPIQLEAGDLPLRVEYERKPGTQVRLQLQWESDFFKLEPIPASAFAYGEEPAEIALHNRIARGRELIEERNCTACHESESNLLPSWRGPGLTSIGTRVSTNWIFHWLKNPIQFRASAVMPSLLQNEQECADVTSYLASLREAKADLEEPASSDTQISRGANLFQSVGCLACHSENGATLTGLGSKMTPGHLARYIVSPLAIDPSGRMPDMSLNRAEAERIALFLVQSKNAEFEKPALAGDPERGRQLVRSRGCVNCHALHDPAGEVTSTMRATRFSALKASQGCLAEKPVGLAPQFNFRPEDRESIAAYLESPDRSESPVADCQRLIKKFNCTACHEWNGPAQLSFEANQSPPSLTDAGNKLRRSWLDQVLHQRKRIRPWMKLRMPQYGPANVGLLVDLLAAHAGAEFGEGERVEKATTEQVQAGIKLIGREEGGLSCINCHDYRGEPSGGEMRGPDMTEMHNRIRVGWLRRWLREPGRIQPGAAMPAFFTEMPEAQGEQMITSILHALAAGPSMPIPPALGEAAQAYFLQVKDEPIVFRTFIPDSSPRSIAVGLPGQNSFVFDAQLCRLRYAWTGDFLDVKPVWADRGGGQAKILGAKYYVAPDFHPLRVGNPEQEPRVQFKGYRLVNGIPEFMYEVNGVPVRELIDKAPQGAGLIRSFEIGAVASEVWFVAGASDAVVMTCSAGPLEAGRIKVGDSGPAQFEVTIANKTWPVNR